MTRNFPSLTPGQKEAQVMWHKSLSPHLKVLETSSSSFVSVLLSPPGLMPSLHTAVYLPTTGKEGEWLSSLLDLEQHVMEVIEKHHGELATYLHGDFNASTKNKTRATYLSAAVSRLKLSRVIITHPTYHHFTGNGDSDSDLDLLLYGGGEGVNESLVNTVCELEHPLMFSHHDLFVSTCTIPSHQY